MNTIIGAVLGLCFFIAPLWAYRRGLRDGLGIQQGKPLEPIKAPISRPPPAQTPDPVAEGLANILAYDGTSQEAKE